MKSCPTCNRTFEDTFTFCLIDGSVLSAPLDSAAGKPAPPARDTDPPRTEVLTTAIGAERLPPTRAATPTPDLQPTITAPPPSLPQLSASVSKRVTAKPSGIGAKVWIGVAVALAAVVLGLIVLAAVYRLGARNKNRVDINITTPPANRPSLTIRIRHNDCDPPKVFLISWSVDGVAAITRQFDRGDEAQVIAKQSFSLGYLGYNYSLHKCMELTINGRRAKLPTDKENVLITTDNYQQFLE
jgi:hypothetical protein